ncbi:histidine--tRNA ligase [Murdochiella sp. Marseille-P8839]|nr:histidine--tRNA ligase [Murdochiella sp. Marseille-P8839]
MIQPSIMAGFMELLPEEQVLFEHVKQAIEKTYQHYGYWPLDTPAIEKNEILFAKGGGETTKQIYHIEKGENSVDQSLRFDLTVPLARYVAQHSSELSFPFRRYHIGKVYRGERNQKGRYREFYQADVDVIGLDELSVINDAECPAVIYEVFRALEIPVVHIHINHRGMLNGFFTSIGIRDAMEVLHAIDKLAKIGPDAVGDLLEMSGVNKQQQEEIFRFIGLTDDRPAEERLEAYNQALAPDAPGAEQFKQGWADLQLIMKGMQGFGMPKEAIVLDLSITRGLDYYTGVVYETFIEGYESIGSVASGGRYDDLASNFTKLKMPGVGISIGVTRLFYQLREANLIQPKKGEYIQAMVLPMSDAELDFSLECVHALRDANIRVQLYTESGRMKKKFSYADAIGVRYVLIIGESEREAGVVSLKDMQSGEQSTMMLAEAIGIMRDASGRGNE